MAKEILPKTYVTKNETIGAVVNFEKTSVGIQGKTVNGSFAVEVWDEKIIRTRVTKREQFETQPYAVHVKPDPSVKWNFFESNTSITITTKKITAVIHKHLFRVSFRDASGKIINEDDTSFGVSWIGDEMTVYKSLQEGERFIGLGEKTGPLNRRGQGYTNWNTDYCGYPEITDPIYATIPFYVGITKSSLYGLFLNNSYKSHFNFGAANTRFSSITVEHGDIDYFFIHDASIPGIIERYTYLTGRMPLPPMWSLGYHQSRYSYFPDNNAIIVATSFRARGIPCDAITLDIHYMDAYKVFTWHPTRYANPQEFTSLLRQLGFHTTVIIDPGIKIEDGYSVYEDGKKSNAFVTYPDGTNYVGEVWPGLCHFPDFTSAHARAWWEQQLTQYAQIGVSGYWIDMNEFAILGTSHVPNLMTFDFEGEGGTMAKARNVYALTMAKATYNGAKKALGGERPFLLTRAAFSGSQRYTAIWTGDNNSTDDHMLVGIRMINSLGISGYAFAGCDIGGFTGNPSSRLFTRWMTIAAFTPFFRGHSALNTNAAEPWAYGEFNEEIVKDFIQMRYNLMPYIYSIFYEAAETGMPIARSLAIENPYDDWVYNENFQNQFMLGDAILVAPTRSEEHFAKVYLPYSEHEWYDFHTFRKYKSNTEIIVDADLYQLPLFIKSSSVLFMQSPIQSTSETNDGTLYIHIFNGTNPSKTVYYEDNGTDFSYEKNEYQKRELIFSPLENIIVFTKATGTFNSKFKDIQFYFHGFRETMILITDNGSLQPTTAPFSFHTQSASYFKKKFITHPPILRIPYSSQRIEVFYKELK